MKKICLLIIVIILQLVSSSVIACEVNISSETSVSSVSKQESSSIISSVDANQENSKNNTAESHQDPCKSCVSCSGLIFTSYLFDINFVTSTFLVNYFSHGFGYIQPFINFDQKPPARA
jgi:hypothetical protein